MASGELATDGRNAIIIITILGVTSTVCTFTRLWIRRKGLLGADDYTLAFALVMLWAQSAGGYIRK